MRALKKKARPRRVDARRGPPPGEATRWVRFRRAGAPGSIALALGFYLAVLLMAAWPLDPLGYRVGQYVANDITARCDFKVISPEKLSEAERDARITAPAVFRVNIALVDEIAAALKSLPGRVRAAARPADLDKDLRKRFALNSEQALASWRNYADAAGKKALAVQVAALRGGLVQTYLVRAEDAESQRAAARIILVVGDEETAAARSELVSLGNARRIRQSVVPALARSIDEPLRGSVGAYLMSVFSESRPVYRYDDAATKKGSAASAEAVRRSPPEHCYRAYEPGDILVRRSRRQTAEGPAIVQLSEAEYRLLQAEQRVHLEAERRDAPWSRRLRILGRAAVLLLLTILLGGYVAHYAPQIVRDHWRGLVIAASMILMLAVSEVMGRAGANPYAAVMPVLVAVFVLAIACDQRFALGIGAVLSAYIVLQMRADLVMLIVLMVAVAAGVVQLREVRTRSKLIQVSAVAGGVVFACTWAHALAESVPWQFALADSLWGAGAALLAGFLVQGILPLIERIFGVATSMTLLEWCDASKPLLQRLRTDAPGTYNHSLQLGSVCEAAAEAVGAKPLLARVGAYYHDIGKMNKAEYFVENQDGSPSKHEKLSPAMSLLIVTGHVKDGLELARKYGLPRILHEFIATHHGTTLVQYFYKAATERRKTDTERAPDEVEFRYPGPKPHAREAAILMLADAAESSVRAMAEPVPGRIENQVHAMVQRRLMDGQLDECDLTLSQVHKVETSLTKSLCAIYHPRVAYPTPDGERPAAAELPNEKQNSRQARNDQAEKTERPARA